MFLLPLSISFLLCCVPRSSDKVWLQKKTLTPEKQDLTLFLREISLPYSSNRKRQFSKSADTALFSGYKNASLFCIKIGMQICQRTLILIQFEVCFLLLSSFLQYLLNHKELNLLPFLLLPELFHQIPIQKKIIVEL